MASKATMAIVEYMTQGSGCYLISGVKGYEPHCPSVYVRKQRCLRSAMSHTCYISGFHPIKNLYQGKTPLHFACSTGIADCVQELARRKADFSKLDHKGRGCLQLAEQCQGDGQSLAVWRRGNVKDLPDTDKQGRAPHEKRKGSVSSGIRYNMEWYATNSWRDNSYELHENSIGGQGTWKQHEQYWHPWRWQEADEWDWHDWRPQPTQRKNRKRGRNRR